jgi:hypothetical protein
MSRRRSRPGHPYRHDGDDAQRRTERLEAEVDTLSARISRVYWKHLGGELVSLRDQIERSPPPQTQTQWQERETALEEYRNQLAHAIERAPDVEASLTALAHTITLDEPWPVEGSTVWLAHEWAKSRSGQAHDYAPRLAGYVGRHDPNAQVFQRPFQRLRVPLAKIAEVPVAIEMVMIEDSTWSFCVTTPVARALPKVFVRPKTWLHGVSEGLGIGRDAKTGEREFDDYFMVGAEASTALLDENLRQLLLAFAHHAPPTLTIAAASAALRWQYMFTTDRIDRAVEILGVVRHRRIEVTLLR